MCLPEGDKWALEMGRRPKDRGGRPIGTVSVAHGDQGLNFSLQPLDTTYLGFGDRGNREGKAAMSFLPHVIPFRQALSAELTQTRPSDLSCGVDMGLGRKSPPPKEK